MKKWMCVSLVVSVMFIMAILVNSCLAEPSTTGRDYRHDMINFVINISSKAKANDTDFLIIPQNGQELLRHENNSKGYIDAIDGIGREDLFFGYGEDNLKTSNADIEYMMDYLELAEVNEKKILVTDYCTDIDKVTESYTLNKKHGYTSFAAVRDLNTIPLYPDRVFMENDEDVHDLRDVDNFLYLINPELYTSKEDFISELQATNYDLLIIDAYFNETALSREDVISLKTKDNGGKRLVVCYMSIGEAEDYRYYWRQDWDKRSPKWLLSENPEWEGNYKVKYWDKNFQSIIYGDEDSYLDKILSVGFDGVYLDLIDAFEYFEINGAE